MYFCYYMIPIQDSRCWANYRRSMIKKKELLKITLANFLIWFITSSLYICLQLYHPSSNKKQNLFSSLRDLLVPVEPAKKAINSHGPWMTIHVCLFSHVISAGLKSVNVHVSVQNICNCHACCVSWGRGETANSRVVLSSSAEGLPFGVWQDDHTPASNA